MKKALVLLLILAVAGGIFAQDLSVGLAGEVRMGADIDFIGGPLDETTITPNEDHTYGLAKITFDKGAGHFDLGFKVDYNGGASGSLTATGEFGDGVNDEEAFFKLHAGVAMGDGFLFDVDSLYGYWFFLDRQIKVDVAYKGYETIYWRASDVVSTDWDNLDGMSGVEISWMPNFLSGLNVGVFFPGEHPLDGATPYGAFPSSASGWFLDDFLGKFVLGAKYELDTLAFSFMFKMDPEDDKAFNVGFNFTGIDNLYIGLDTQWEGLGDFKGSGIFGVGANAEYASAPITAGITIKMTEFGFDGGDGALCINPYFYYDLVADTLQFRISPAIAFGIQDDKSARLDTEFDLFWNMNQDGCTDDPAMGLLVTYNLGVSFKDPGKGLDASNLGVYFRWAF